jgi:D-beta-D-heptose 7-phosphate kinase/D-beta-D-heptose 1-phosphate adenosyltransferase
MISRMQDLLPLVESGWRNVPVLVVGDVMLDQYVWGEVARISPEAPVPIVRATMRDERPGGAANVAMNLAGLGASVTLVGFGGGDREQAALESLVAEQGVEPRLTKVPVVPTTTKLRILSGHQQMMRVDSESTQRFSAQDYRQLLSSAVDALGSCAVVILSDYAKGVLTDDICQSVIQQARRLQIPVLVDPKVSDFARYRGATCICPNRKELSLATGRPAADLSELLAAGQQLVRSLDVEFMPVTLGENGITVLRHDSSQHLPAVVRQVFDVSGAGDTVIAVLALATASHVPIEIAAQLANLGAGIVVGKAGTAPITKAELIGALAERAPLAMQEKVLSLDHLIARLTAWKNNGERIVFTNGCFDILHIGHISLLEEARRKGDRLIVGLNSDSSVRTLKGLMRPIVGERERAHVLAALSAVDAVVVFAEATPLRLIEAIRPDVLVKGGDYTRDSVVGSHEVLAWGGRVELIPLREGISTSRLIASAAAPPAISINRFSA